jgi:hypothetical protein
MEEGQSAQEACDASMKFFEDHIPVGVLAVSRSGYGVSCNTDMAWWAGKG